MRPDRLEDGKGGLRRRGVERELALSTASDLGLGRQLGLDFWLVAAPSPGPLGVSLLQPDPFPAEAASAAHPGIYSLSAGHGCFCVWERGRGFSRVLT